MKYLRLFSDYPQELAQEIYNLRATKQQLVKQNKQLKDTLEQVRSSQLPWTEEDMTTERMNRKLIQILHQSQLIKPDTREKDKLVLARAENVLKGFSLSLEGPETVPLAQSLLDYLRNRLEGGKVQYKRLQLWEISSLMNSN